MALCGILMPKGLKEKIGFWQLLDSPQCSLWASPVICVTRMEIFSVRKFEGAMKAKRKVLSNLNNCSPEQKSVAKKAKRILFFILN